VWRLPDSVAVTAGLAGSRHWRWPLERTHSSVMSQPVRFFRNLFKRAGARAEGSEARRTTWSGNGGYQWGVDSLDGGPPRAVRAEVERTTQQFSEYMIVKRLLDREWCAPLEPKYSARAGVLQRSFPTRPPRTACAVNPIAHLHEALLVDSPRCICALVAAFSTRLLQQFCVTGPPASWPPTRRPCSGQARVSVRPSVARTSTHSCPVGPRCVPWRCPAVPRRLFC
jgi:hypothetical protein